MISYRGLSVDSSCFNLDNMGSNLQLDSGLTQSADSSGWKIQHINHSDSFIEMYINIIDIVGWAANSKESPYWVGQKLLFCREKKGGVKKNISIFVLVSGAEMKSGEMAT